MRTRHLIVFCIFLLSASGVAATGSSSSSIRVLTFNTGTAFSQASDDAAPWYFDEIDAEISDTYYGNGLAWKSAVSAVARFIATESPEIIGFQEIFDSSECVDIPLEFHREFVCEDWFIGRKLLVQDVVGERYQVACHKMTNSKCIAVRKDFATIRGCDRELCRNFLDGFPIPDCGSRARVARANLDTTAGEALTLVHVHGTSGIKTRDRTCRKKQFRQVFKNLGDGQPGANGRINMVLGDFNTDPHRLNWLDKSARYLRETAARQGFSFHTEENASRLRTFRGLVSIDHVLSDHFQGSCIFPGVTPGTEPVLQKSYFDHAPALCTLYR